MEPVANAAPASNEADIRVQPFRADTGMKAAASAHINPSKINPNGKALSQNSNDLVIA
jgi:hypothetical protein